MNVKVKFIGDDLSFYDDVKKRYEKSYSSIKFEFSQISIKVNNDSISVMKSIYDEEIDIIFIDFEDDPIFSHNLSLLINSNAELRKKSLCALHGFNDKDKSIENALLAEVRINHIKGIEIHDIIFDTISFLDVEKSKNPPFIAGEGVDDLELEFSVRVCYATPKYLHVETSTKLELNTIVELSSHPLNHLVKSNRFRVVKESNANLFYNTRFSYDLEFTYIDDQFFRSSESYWLDSLKYSDDKKAYETATGEDYGQMLRVVKTRRNRIRYAKNDHVNWIEQNKNESVKKTKILIFDDSLGLIRETRKFKDSIIKFETGLIYDYYQIRRFNPHLIIFNVTEKQDESRAIELFKYLKEKEDHIYVCVTNSTSEFDYHKYITFPTDLDLSTFTSMLEKFKSKIDISSDKQRVFFDVDGHKSFITSKISGSILQVSESEVYFESISEIPDWTVFKTQKPIPMLLTVVPHISGGDFSKKDNCYRALINGTNELSKADLRVLINQSLVEEDEENKDV